MTAYDPSNLFARILRGEIPCHKVYEDEHAFAFMDIMPQADGHVLVLPKRPSRNVLDADPAVFGPLMAAVQKIARAASAAFGADGAIIKQYNEEAAGQTVFHLHIHIVPCKAGAALRPHGSHRADHSELARQAEMIKAAL